MYTGSGNCRDLNALLFSMRPALLCRKYCVRRLYQHLPLRAMRWRRCCGTARCSPTMQRGKQMRGMKTGCGSRWQGRVVNNRTTVSGQM